MGAVLPCVSQQAGFVCYQPLNPAFCPTEEIPNCNGLEDIGAICEGDSGPQCDFNGDLDNCPALDGDDAYVRVRCPGASKSAKSSEFPGILPTGTFPAMQQQQQQQDEEVTIKDESTGEQVAGIDGGSELAEIINTNPIEYCDDSTKAACYQESTLCPVDEPPECNGLEFIGAYCLAKYYDPVCDDLDTYDTNCPSYGYRKLTKEKEEGEGGGKWLLLLQKREPTSSRWWEKQTFF